MTGLEIFVLILAGAAFIMAAHANLQVRRSENFKPLPGGEFDPLEPPPFNIGGSVGIRPPTRIIVEHRGVEPDRPWPRS